MTRRMRNYKAMVDVESLQGVVTCADAQSDKVLNSDSINEGESDVESRTLTTDRISGVLLREFLYVGRPSDEF
jgi:hypothetical protein